jgi:hypothetical protein
VEVLGQLKVLYFYLLAQITQLQLAAVAQKELVKPLEAKVLTLSFLQSLLVVAVTVLVNHLEAPAMLEGTVVLVVEAQVLILKTVVPELHLKDMVVGRERLLVAALLVVAAVLGQMVQQVIRAVLVVLAEEALRPPMVLVVQVEVPQMVVPIDQAVPLVLQLKVLLAVQARSLTSAAAAVALE